MCYSEKNEQYVCYGDFCVDLVKNVLGMLSGKIEIYLKMLEKFGYKDCLVYLIWLVFDEWKGIVDEKQLQFLIVYLVYCLHSQLNYVELCKKYVIVDCELIIIYIEDVVCFGIVNGDLVCVWNKCGQILIGVVVIDGIKKGVVCVYEGVWLDLENGLCKNGSVNVLMVDIFSLQLVNVCVGNLVLVYIEKYMGNVLKLMVFDQLVVQV